MSKATLLQGDCLELMNRIPDSSIDMVLSDRHMAQHAAGGTLRSTCRSCGNSTGEW